MKIKWHGHACFELQSNDGVKIVTDPFDESVGYDVPQLDANIVTISHGHYDHNNVSAVSGDLELFDGEGVREVKGIAIEGIPTFHDDTMGSKRGKNIVFKYTIDGMTICHIGDLGHMLTDEQLQKLEGLDILLIPVGGTYTIDSIQASELVKQLSPKIIIPMHYKTRKLKFNLEPVENFAKNFDAEYIDSNEIEIDKNLINNVNKVIVMKY